MKFFASPSLSRILCLSTAVLVSSIATCEGFSEDDVVQTRSTDWCPNAFFNFGDSLSDTGNTQLAIPGLFMYDTFPYGETFFEQPAGRASNGRLVIDFILMAFKMPLLSPSALLSHAKDMQGLNFAYSGATATPINFFVPYPLPYQVEQFMKLKDQVLQTQREQGLALKELDQDTYSDALYTLCIGGNDLVAGISTGLQPEAIIQYIVPDVLNEIVSAIEALYSEGARKFIVFNGPPLGCSSSVLGILEDSGLPLDDLGCITAVNEINDVLNSELFRSVQRLRASLPNVTIIHFDYYAANVEILSNPTKYGFNPDLVHRFDGDKNCSHFGR
ncbi:unnamed protein product [Calypogeia fissa]